MPKLTRKVDWQERLYQFIDARRARAFVWGRQDCGMFAADGVREMTGVDLASPWRGQYKTAKAAKRTVGKRDLLAFVNTSTNLPPHNNLRNARRGDLVMLKTANSVLASDAHCPEQTLAICIGASAVAPGKAGLVNVKMCHAIAAWRIG